MPCDYEWNIVSFSIAPGNFNKEFWKYVTPQFDEYFLSGGIFQFYPNYFAYKDGRMHIKQDDGSTHILAPYDGGKSYHEFFLNMSKGACV